MTSSWPTGWRAGLLWMIPVTLGVVVVAVAATFDEPPRSRVALAMMCAGLSLVISSMALVPLGPAS